jgi:tRNA 2-thiouridine synthesizing protein A
MHERGEIFPRPIRTLDCIGLYCPEPVFRTREEISSWAKRAGHELLSVEKTEEGYRFLIRRGA